MALKSKDLTKVRDDVPTVHVPAAAGSDKDQVRVNILVEEATRLRWRSEALRLTRGNVKEMIVAAVEEYIKKH